MSSAPTRRRRGRGTPDTFAIDMSLTKLTASVLPSYDAEQVAEAVADEVLGLLERALQLGSIGRVVVGLDEGIDLVAHVALVERLCLVPV